MTPEKEVQSKILNYLSKLEKEGKSIFYEKRQAGGYNYKKGIPDIYCVVNGQHIEIEVKREKGGLLSPMQEKFRDKCKLKNIKWMLINNFKEFKECIDELLK